MSTNGTAHTQVPPVILRSSAGEMIAERLDLEIVDNPLDAGIRPLILVVSQPAEVQWAHRLVSNDVQVAGVITWHLNPAAVLNAVSIKAPVHIGLPEPDRLVDFLSTPPGARQNQLNESVRAAALSKMLLKNRGNG